MKQGDLLDEVQAIVDAGIAANRTVPATWLTNEVIESHPDIKGRDVDWYRLCAYEHVRDTVRKVLRQYKGLPDETPRQIILPGCERLQRAYLVEREGEQTVVPIDQLTEGEITTKIREYERMAAGCIEHAEELRRYQQQRAA
jgi:hypothetical protein